MGSMIEYCLVYDDERSEGDQMGSMIEYCLRRFSQMEGLRLRIFCGRGHLEEHSFN